MVREEGNVTGWDGDRVGWSEEGMVRGRDGVRVGWCEGGMVIRWYGESKG